MRSCWKSNRNCAAQNVAYERGKMNAAIKDFIEYADLFGLPFDEQGGIAMRLESGIKLTIDPDGQTDELLVSVFYPCPWRLLDLGIEALQEVHYKRAVGRAIAAGTMEDRLVLSTRLPRSRQAPQEIERAARDLCDLATRCLANADAAAGHRHDPLAEAYAR
jgi:hypothetical protein